MRVVFFGNPQFAVPTFQSIFVSRHEICCVITGPDRKAGRNQNMCSSPVKTAALSCKLPVLQPENLNSTEFILELAAYKPEIGVIVAYRILPQEVFALPPKGCVNLHPSLLPDLRGAAPINWALIRGYRQSGLTTFMIKERVDTGSILVQEPVDVFPEDNAGSLSKRLASRGAELMLETLDKIAAGKLVPTPQTGKPTRAPKITDETCLIHWNLPATEINNLVRGLSPSPCAYTFLRSKRLKISRSSISEGTVNHNPGSVIGLSGNTLNVCTTEGILEIEELQLEGKRRMSAAEFSRGNLIPVGAILGE